MEEMKGVHQRAEKFGSEAKAFAQEKGKTFGSEVGSVAKRGSRSLGDIIALLFKIFAYFILGCICFALVVALFAVAIMSIGLFPLKDFLLTDGLQSALAWSTLIFFIAVPVIGVITWLIRRLAKIKTNRRFMRLSFTSLWIIGWICFISLCVSVGRDFKNENRPKEEEIFLSNPGISKLEITTNDPLQKFHRNRSIRFEPFEDLDEDTVYVNNVEVQIVKSPNDSFKVTMVKFARGRNVNDADTHASLINFTAEQKDSLLIIDKGIPITKKDKFRNQEILLTVYVPVGKQIRINRSVPWGRDVHFEFGWNNRHDWDYYDNPDAMYGWDRDVDYIMQPKGLYTLDGKPADERNEPKSKNRRGTHITIDANGINVQDGDDYRYDNNTVPAIDSLRQKLEREQQRAKDSLQKAKDKIEQQLEKLDDKANGPTAFVPYSLPSYNPMLNMN